MISPSSRRTPKVPQAQPAFAEAEELRDVELSVAACADGVSPSDESVAVMTVSTD